MSYEWLQPPLAGTATHVAARPSLSPRIYAAVVHVVVLRRESDGTAWVIEPAHPVAAWRTRFFHTNVAALYHMMRGAA